MKTLRPSNSRPRRVGNLWVSANPVTAVTFVPEPLEGFSGITATMAAAPAASYTEDYSSFTPATTALNIHDSVSMSLLNKPVERGGSQGFAVTTYTNLYAIVASPTREGGQSLKIRNRPDIKDAEGKSRVEMRYADSDTLYNSFVFGHDYWIGTSVYFDPSTWPTDNIGKYIIFWQPLSTSVGPKLVMQARHAQNATNNAVAVQAFLGHGPTEKDPTTGVTNGTTFKFEPNGFNSWKLGQWYDIIMHFRYSGASTDGRCELWIKDTVTKAEYKLIDHIGQVGYSDETIQPWYKHGLYYSFETRTAEYIAYFGPVRMHKTAATTGYATVAPRDVVLGTPAEYYNDYERVVGSNDAGKSGESIQWSADNNLTRAGMTIQPDPVDANKRALRVVSGWTPADAIWNGSDYRHRWQISVGNCIELSNDLTGPHTSGQAGLRLVPDGEYWFGFRFWCDMSSDHNDWDHYNFIWGAIAETVGDFAIMQRFGDPGNPATANQLIWQCIFERYRDEVNIYTTHETKREFITTRGKWHDYVIRLVHKPYSRGVYIPGVFGGPKLGIGQLWCDGVLVIDEQNIYTGTDRKGIVAGDGTPAPENNARFKYGQYFGTYSDVNPNGTGTRTTYLDDLRVALGPNRYNDVKPGTTVIISPPPDPDPPDPDPVDATVYTQNWSTFTTSSTGWTIDAAPDLTIERGPTWDPPGMSPNDYPYQRTFVASPSRDGGLSLRIENRIKEGALEGGDLIKARVEVRYGDNHAQSGRCPPEDGVDYWIGFSMRFDSSTWPTSATQEYIAVAQPIINVNGPKLAFYARSKLTTDATKVRVYAHYASDLLESNDFTNSVSHGYEVGGVWASWELDRWYDIIIHVVRSNASDTGGTMEIWVKDVVTGSVYKMIDDIGVRVGYADEAFGQPKYISYGTSTKLGLYRGANPARDITYVAYYGPLRLWRGVDGYSKVAPRDASSPPVGTVPDSPLADYEHLYNYYPTGRVTRTEMETAGFAKSISGGTELTPAQPYNSYEFHDSASKPSIPPRNIGERILRTEIQSDYANHPTDPTITKARAELEEAIGREGEFHGYVQGDEIWMGYAFYFPSNEGDNAAYWARTDMDIPTSAYNMPYILQNSNYPLTGDDSDSNEYRLGVQGNLHFRYSLGTGYSPFFDCARVLEMDKWNDIVVRHVPAVTPAKTILQVWINDVLRIDLNVAMGNTNNTLHRDKHGLYVGNTTTFGSYRFVKYSSPFRMAKGANRYNDVRPLRARALLYEGSFSDGIVQSQTSMVDGGFIYAMKDAGYVNGNSQFANGGAGGYGTTIDSEVRLTASETVGGVTVLPRAGGYFLRGSLSKTKDYNILSGGAVGDIAGVGDKPRWGFTWTNSVYKMAWDTEFWVGFSIYLPLNWEHDDSALSNQSTIQMFTITGGNASRQYITLGVRSTSPYPAMASSQWSLQVRTDATDTTDVNVGDGTTIALGDTANDLGQWTDFVFRVRINPFSVSSNPYALGVPNSPVNATFAGNKGILQVWKRSGTGNSRKMVLTAANTVNAPVGLVPTTANNNGIDMDLRMYKYGWKRLPTRAAGPVWAGFDEIRFGETVRDGTRYADVHPGMERQP